MMRRNDLLIAMHEAQRFVERAKDLIEATKRTDTATQAAFASLPNSIAPIQKWYTDSPREQGAVKRASMDLTRALANLRKRESKR